MFLRFLFVCTTLVSKFMVCDEEKKSAWRCFAFDFESFFISLFFFNCLWNGNCSDTIFVFKNFDNFFLLNRQNIRYFFWIRMRSVKNMNIFWTQAVLIIKIVSGQCFYLESINLYKWRRGSQNFWKNSRFCEFSPN